MCCVLFQVYFVKSLYFIIWLLSQNQLCLMNLINTCGIKPKHDLALVFIGLIKNGIISLYFVTLKNTSLSLVITLEIDNQNDMNSLCLQIQYHYSTTGDRGKEMSSNLYKEIRNSVVRDAKGRVVNASSSPPPSPLHNPVHLRPLENLVSSPGYAEFTLSRCLYSHSISD